jgi:short-subunit dehydrogenase
MECNIMTRRSLDPNTVVLLTGASSGIGRATALAFAERRVRLVLAARDAAALEEVAALCRARGSETLVHACDLGETGAAAGLAAAAVAAFGRIDVWVSCAAVMLFGRFEDVSEAEFRRVVDVNLHGYLDGARAALACFRAQGDSGTLINVGSVLGRIGEAEVSAYSTTKYALRGWATCLRQELHDTPGIRACMVLPAPFDTPIYQKAANRSGRTPRAIWPVGRPEQVAAAIVRLAQRPRDEIVVGWFGSLLVLGERLAPRLLERLSTRIAPALQFEPGRAEPTAGNLWQATGPHTEGGGWRRYWRERLRRQGRP